MTHAQTVMLPDQKLRVQAYGENILRITLTANPDFLNRDYNITVPDCQIHPTMSGFARCRASQFGVKSGTVGGGAVSTGFGVVGTVAGSVAGSVPSSEAGVVSTVSSDVAFMETGSGSVGAVVPSLCGWVSV